jgi:hypothetical protein
VNRTADHERSDKSCAAICKVKSCAAAMAGLFLGENSVGGYDLICPRCQSHHCQRSRRRSATDFIAGVSRIRPWRCGDCNKRFFAWKVPLKFLGYAHCRRCGRFELQRVSRELGEGTFSFLWRLLRLPAYRCPPCRNRFFSLLPRMHHSSANPQAVAGDQPTQVG